MKPSESITDPCITGHASSSVSVALGMAHARTIRGEKYHVVAVIGDGALTGGMAYEALTDAGASKEPIIVVLNDNNMSIDKNVGGMARHLARLRVSPRYLNAKSHLKHSLARIPGGKAIVAQGTKIKSAIKSVMLPSSMFEQMGFTYLGPVDGHDLKALTFHLQLAKRLKCPVLLHVMTKKEKVIRTQKMLQKNFMVYQNLMHQLEKYHHQHRTFLQFSVRSFQISTIGWAYLRSNCGDAIRDRLI